MAGLHVEVLEVQQILPIVDSQRIAPGDHQFIGSAASVLFEHGTRRYGDEKILFEVTLGFRALHPLPAVVFVRYRAGFEASARGGIFKTEQIGGPAPFRDLPTSVPDIIPFDETGLPFFQDKRLVVTSYAAARRKAGC